MTRKAPRSATAARRRTLLALVCTKGGHFEQMTNLSDLYSRYEHFWITNRAAQTESRLKDERAYYLDLAHFRKPWTYLFHLAPLIGIFSREKPTHVLSTGSGRTALVPYLLARLFRIPFLHVDTFSRVRSHSKFGTFLLTTGSRIYTQWEDPGHKKAIYIGPIFKGGDNGAARAAPKHVFVTLGTREEPFTRLLKGVEELVAKGVIRETVIIQAGHTGYRPARTTVFDFCSAEAVDELIRNARYVITQESAGIGTQCLRHKTPFIVMPRDYRYGELPTKSDMKEDLHEKLAELGYTAVVRSAQELERAVLAVDSLRTGFVFDNGPALSLLQKALEEP